MDLTIHGISLRSVRYSDSAAMVTAWSAERGMVALAVNWGAGREAKRRKALMMPMGTFEGVAHTSAGQSVMRISDLRPFGAIGVSDGNPVKSMIAMFLAEFLQVVLRESPADDHLSQFLFDAIASLKAARGRDAANFHILFLYKLSMFLGIEPDPAGWQRGSWFDLREARFSATAPTHRRVLAPADAAIIRLMHTVPLDRAGLLPLDRAGRNRALDYILDYYTLHLTPVVNLQSLQVVRSMLS